EDEGAVVGDGDGVLGVGGVGAVGGAQRPAVGVDLVVAAAGGQHRLDGEGHAGPQRQPAAGTAPVGDGRVLVHAAADAVAAEVARHRVGAAVSGGDGVDGVAEVAEPVAGCGGGDARFQGAAGGVDEGLVGGAGRADGDAEGGVARPAVEVGAAVDAEQVAVAQPVAAGDAVDDGVVDRDADDGGVGGGGEGGPVAEEGGFGACFADDGGGQLVEAAKPAERKPGSGPTPADIAACTDIDTLREWWQAHPEHRPQIEARRAELTAAAVTGDDELPLDPA